MRKSIPVPQPPRPVAPGPPSNVASLPVAPKLNLQSFWDTLKYFVNLGSAIQTRMDNNLGLPLDDSYDSLQPPSFENGFPNPFDPWNLQNVGLPVIGGMVPNPGSESAIVKWVLSDGVRMTTNEALSAAEKFLGTGYRDMGNGRFLSADGTKQVRMGNSDIIGQRPHMNFETLGSSPARPGKMQVTNNFHIYLEDP